MSTLLKAVLFPENSPDCLQPCTKAAKECMQSENMFAGHEPTCAMVGGGGHGQLSMAPGWGRVWMCKATVVYIICLRTSKSSKLCWDVDCMLLSNWDSKRSLTLGFVLSEYEPFLKTSQDLHKRKSMNA